MTSLRPPVLEPHEELADRLVDPAAAELVASRGGFWRLMFPAWWTVVLAVVVCVVVPSGLIVSRIDHNPKFSPIDELSHYAYVDALRHGHFPTLGDHYDQQVMRAAACTKIALTGFATPPCTSTHFSPGQFPGAGILTEAAQPPTYYAVTAALSLIPIHLFGASDLFGTRLVNCVWISMGLLLLWGAGRLARLSPLRIGAGALLVGVSAIPITAATIVNNDASSLFAGSLVLFVGLLAWTRPGRWVPWVLAATSVFVATLKPTDMMPVIVLAALFGLAGIERYLRSEVPTEPWSRAVLVPWLKTGGVMLVAGGVASVGWMQYLKATSTISSHLLCLLTQPPTGPPITQIFSDATVWWQPLSGPGTLNDAGHAALVTLAITLSTITTYLVIGGALAVLVVRPRRWYHSMGFVSLAVAFLVGSALGGLSWVNCHVPLGVEPRYSLPLASMLVVSLVAAVRGRIVLWSIWTFGGIVLATDLALIWR